MNTGTETTNNTLVVTIRSENQLGYFVRWFDSQDAQEKEGFIHIQSLPRSRNLVVGSQYHARIIRTDGEYNDLVLVS